ncbi:MAG TPA: SdpI family protein [Pyrinomonadaceae bacterium]
MSESVGLPLVFVAVGIVFAALGVPLARGRVRPNFWYGCRTHKTLSDEKIWYAVNRVTGRDLIAGGACISAAALALLAAGRGMNPTARAIVLLSVTSLSVVAMAVDSRRVSRRM